MYENRGSDMVLLYAIRCLRGINSSLRSGWLESRLLSLLAKKIKWFINYQFHSLSSIPTRVTKTFDCSWLLRKKWIRLIRVWKLFRRASNLRELIDFLSVGCNVTWVRVHKLPFDVVRYMSATRRSARFLSTSCSRKPWNIRIRTPLVVVRTQPASCGMVCWQATPSRSEGGW